MSRSLKETKPWPKRIRFFDRLTQKDRTVFFKHLSIMIEAGVPLEKGLLAIHKQSQSRTFHRILHVILSDLSSGENLSSSMKNMPHVFDDLVTNLVSVGETTGTLSEALLRINAHFEKIGDLQKKIISALIYPIIVVFGTMATVTYLVFVLLPQITPLFASMGTQLPTSTLLVMRVAQFVATQWFWLVLLFVLALCVFYVLMKWSAFRYTFHSFLLRVPIIGTLIKRTQVAQFSQMLGALLASGVHVVESFKIAAKSLGHPVYRRALEKIGDSIQDGEDIGRYLEEHPNLFSPLVTQMIHVGEETGHLDKSFFAVATFTEQEMDEVIKVFTTLLEPALMLVIGGLVGFVAIAVITPIYQLTSGIGV